ncbi:short wavelength-sensitive type 2 cone [Labeo rohita]|uniref:Short wavelength-sensitive type 2 cone n=1 Tax=Labeo rohita TaxID=84645 RepID=A0A498MJB5_LABRO|nr:opsin-1, short-wave-sensitive 2 [Labeo rohita]RXN19883.1 short wavelength-sensitive type 2 cone [Labeo rohita]
MKQVPEFHEDFYIPIPLDINNLSAYSPFLVPQDHLGNQGVYMAMAVFMFFIFIGGASINILTIACTIQFKKLRSHLNYILVNLAVANLLVAIFGSPLSCYSFFNRYFIFGATACKIEGFLATLGGMVSLWSLAVVAFERWLVICKPLGNFTFKTPHAIAGCVITWISASAASLPPLFGWSRYIPEGLQCSCGPDWYTTNNKYNNESYVIFLFCFCFAVPFAAIVFCYGQLLITLKLAAKAQADSASTQKAEREVTKMVVVMVLGFLICWAPYATFSLWIVFNRGEAFDLRMATIPSCLSKASTVYNPVIYVLMNKQFRSCMMKMVCGKNIEEDEASTSSQVTQVSSVAPEK